MSFELSGLASYGVFLLTLAAIYAVVSLALNVQWGMTGLFNIGIAGFYAIGAYTSAILTTPASSEHLGGFGLPFVAGLLGAMVTSGIVAVFVGLITISLRSDYLSIASIGIAEIVRLIFKNEDWIGNGVRGIAGIERPIGENPLIYLAVVLVVLALVYVAVERARKSPWGRVLRAVRENELGAQAAGKNVFRFRLEAFVLGSMLMGLGGALYAHFIGFVSPEAFEPVFATFLVWVMLIAGGSGSNKGAVLGAFVIWAVWSGTELLTNLLPADFTTQASALRVLLIGVLLQIILLRRPEGILPEERPHVGASPVSSTEEEEEETA
ncbi:MAG TPA: branched-chain amino acid ABC transporter permease [Candidatus Sulfotelmatobacter sp.]|jgi:branched-chain amino acid transport system permease protein|nr:branched-chain amino acid ABC transporter permease [Candidatus Sulfotelmatobacter sp.]